MIIEEQHFIMLGGLFFMLTGLLFSYHPMWDTGVGICILASVVDMYKRIEVVDNERD